MYVYILLHITSSLTQHLSTCPLGISWRPLLSTPLINLSGGEKNHPKANFRELSILLRAIVNVPGTKRRHADGKVRSSIDEERGGCTTVEEYLWRHDCETLGVLLSGSRCNWRQPDSLLQGGRIEVSRSPPFPRRIPRHGIASRPQSTTLLLTLLGSVPPVQTHPARAVTAVVPRQNEISNSRATWSITSAISLDLVATERRRKKDET